MDGHSDLRGSAHADRIRSCGICVRHSYDHTKKVKQLTLTTANTRSINQRVYQPLIMQTRTQSMQSCNLSNGLVRGASQEAVHPIADEAIETKLCWQFVNK